MAFARASAALLILTLGGLNGMLAGLAETCTQNSPDSLYVFPITLLFNLAGMALLCWEPRRLVVVLVGALPTLLALNYSAIAIQLATGTPACTIITGEVTWQHTGDEGLLALGWSASALIFWIGLAYALTGGYRRAHERDADPFTRQDR